MNGTLLTDRRRTPRTYCSIEDQRLYMALENLATGRGFLGYLTPKEMDALTGVLVKEWFPPCLTKLGCEMHAKLKVRFHEISNTRQH